MAKELVILILFGLSCIIFVGCATTFSPENVSDCASYLMTNEELPDVLLRHRLRNDSLHVRFRRKLKHIRKFQGHTPILKGSVTIFSNHKLLTVGAIPFASSKPDYGQQSPVYDFPALDLRSLSRLKHAIVKYELRWTNWSAPKRCRAELVMRLELCIDGRRKTRQFLTTQATAFINVYVPRSNDPIISWRNQKLKRIQRHLRLRATVLGLALREVREIEEYVEKKYSRLRLSSRPLRTESE